MTTQATPAAAQAYSQSAQRIQALIKQIETRLQTHAHKAGQHPKDWGYVGDLGHVEATLKQLLEGLTP